MDLAGKIRDIPDFPEKGILFRDITTLIKDGEGLKASVDAFVDVLKDIEFDYIVAPESRGFIFGMPVAYVLGKGFVPIRKKGKLPSKTYSKEYSLEYGSATIEMHKDAIAKGQKVVIIDDLLATGGTTRAMMDLVHEAGGEIVKIVFLIELEALGGKNLLGNIPYNSIIKY